MENQDTHLIYTFPRARGEEVQIAIRKYKDRYYADFRVWFKKENETVFHPTKKGLFIAMDRIPELRKGLDRLSKAAEKFNREAAEVEA